MPYLLELNNEIFYLENGYWVKFAAWCVERSEAIPHGIRYSLTLHNQHNQRILGYDNAHPFQAKEGFAAKRQIWDHRHEKNLVKEYVYTSAADLLTDFWQAVDNFLAMENNG